MQIVNGERDGSILGNDWEELVKEKLCFKCTINTLEEQGT